MHDFFQTLIRPDREDPEEQERAAVARAADVLMIGEFQLLQLAYYEWHDEDLPVEMVDRLFTAYMLHKQVPYWAQQFACRILEKDKKGFIDPHDPLYHRYDADYVTHVPQGVKRFCQAAIFLVLFVGGTIIIGQFAAARNAPFQFPPYLDVQTDAAPKSESDR